MSEITVRVDSGIDAEGIRIVGVGVLRTKLSEEEIFAAAITGLLPVVFDSPDDVQITGPADAVAELKAELEANGELLFYGTEAEEI